MKGLVRRSLFHDGDERRSAYSEGHRAAAYWQDVRRTGPSGTGSLGYRQSSLADRDIAGDSSRRRFFWANVIEFRHLMPTDTDPRIEAFIVEGYRRMSASQKFDRVQALTKSVQELALLDVRRRHPSSDPREQALRVASRWLGPKLMRDAFGWDVEETGY